MSLQMWWRCLHDSDIVGLPCRQPALHAVMVLMWSLLCTQTAA